MTSSFDPPKKTIEEWRFVAQHFGKDVGKLADVSIQDFYVRTRTGAAIHCRKFNHQLNQPVFIFYPGCSFIFNFLEVNSVIASQIASIANINVVLVNHRLAPENTIFTCLNDCYDAASHIATHPEFSTSKLLIGGWSSGAHAASFVANTAQFRISHQILLSGSFDYTHSYHEFDAYEAQDPTLDRRLVSHFASSFFSISDLKDSHFAPFWRNDFSHYPPTTLICGEFDAFRNDTEIFFSKLKKSNVPVEKIVLSGQSHNSIVMKDFLEQDPISVLAKVIHEVKKSF